MLGVTNAAGWRLGEPLDGRGYTSVFAVRHECVSPALLKATDTDRGCAELQREVDVLAALHSDPRLDGWTELIPRTLAVGDADGVHFVVESRLPGSDLRTVPVGVERNRMLNRAVDAVVELQSRTAAVKGYRRRRHRPVGARSGRARARRPAQETPFRPGPGGGRAGGCAA